ncbi:MAG: putative toxin-antitoxin system toxin component, PIN family [Hyphomonadaceae bacterium]|nr:putative toxin-antitoxin system toxin component, PIN family [Hyphomonadaceae bacterium]
MRVVLDTSVIVKAVRNPNGASAALISEAIEGRLTLLVSTALGLEYEAVTLRPEHWVWPGFGRPEAERLLDLLAAVSTPVRINFQWRGALPDPDDDMALEVALNGQADALVTFNDRDFAPAVERFGLALVRPHAILETVRKLR